MTVLKYHSTILLILEVDMNYDWEKASQGLARQEAWIKSPDCLLYTDKVSRRGTVQRYYFKSQCCSLLLRSLDLYLETSAMIDGWVTEEEKLAALKLAIRLTRIQELIESLERVYHHFETVKTWQLKL